MEVHQLPHASIQPRGEISGAFLQFDIDHFHQAARTVRDLPYGRTSQKTCLPLVLEQGRGTCSTKHALLAQLAAEQDIDAVQLTLGIYEMSEQNTPGVGQVLHDNNLSSIPEAHCYLSIQGQRFDFTTPETSVSLDEMLAEEVIDPTQIGEYKIQFHLQYLAEWCAETRPNFSTDELWAIREACIAALEQ